MAKSSRSTPRGENAAGRSEGKGFGKELAGEVRREFGEVFDDALKDGTPEDTNEAAGEGTDKAVLEAFRVVADEDTASRNSEKALATTAKADEAGVPATKRRRRARPEFETYNG